MRATSHLWKRAVCPARRCIVAWKAMHGAQMHALTRIRPDGTMCMLLPINWEAAQSHRP